MRHLTPLVAGSAALIALGCSGSVSQAPVAPLPGGSAGSTATTLGSVYVHQDLSQGAVGVYTLDIDPVTLGATVSLKATRSGQANDDLYALAIDNFMRPSSMRVTAISSTATTLDLSYVVSHPFPAPADPTGTPNGSTNRADLCISGFVCFLADLPSATGNTYFTDRVANTAAVANADAYFSPEGMISFGGLSNTFPYKQLVDEVADSRRNGISNGGDVTGNYGADGWTRAEFGANNDGWTGYGILAQGQTSANRVSLNKAELALNGFSLDVAVIAKYNDPRGGGSAVQKRGNRLPPASPDHTAFAYRMPHGALDVASIEYDSETGGFLQDQVSSSTLYFRVVDWDARATETSEGNLADDATVTNVEVGESGLPDFAISIPGVLGDATVIDDWDPALDVLDDDTAWGGDAGQDSGIPGDALFYCKNVTKTVTSGQSFGDFTGLARATDINAATPFWVPLDEGNPPLPLASNLPIPQTYQAFTVTMAPGNLLPTGDWTINTNPIFDGGTTSINVTNIVDPDSATFGIEVNWGDGNGFVSAASGLTPGAGPFGSGASPVYTLANPSVSETRPLAVRLVDEVSSATNPATNVGGDILTIDPAPAGAGWVYLGTMMNAGLQTAIGLAVDNSGNVFLAGIYSNGTDFGGGPRATVTSNDAYLVKLNSAGVYQWDQLFGSTGTFESAYSLGTDNAGNVYVEGRWSGDINFGGGVRTQNATNGAAVYDTFIAKYNGSGVYQWDSVSNGVGFSSTAGSTNEQRGSSLVVNKSTGESAYCGRFDNTETWGTVTLTATNGPTSAEDDPFLIHFTAAGVADWGYSPNAPYTGTEDARAVTIDPAGNFYLGGYTRDGANFGGGVRSLSGGFGNNFIVKLSSTGTYIWDKYFGGESSESVLGMCTDATRLYVTGDCYDGTDFGNGPITMTFNASDPFVAAYLFDGTYQWERVFNAPTNSAIEGQSVASDGTRLFAVGHFTNGVNFGTGPINSAGGDDIYCVSLNPTTGATNYVNTWGSTSSEFVYNVALDAAGDPYVSCEYYVGPIDWDPGTGTVTSTSVGGADLAVVHWLDATNSF